MAMQAMNRSPAPSMERMAPLNRFTTAILESENVVPVVLEFLQPPVAVYKCHNPQADASKYQEDLCQRHQEFLAKLQSLGVEVKLGKSEVVEAVPQGTRNKSVQHDFTYVFNGVGVLMPGRMVASVAKMTDVRAVTLNRERIYLNMEKNIPFTGAPKLWERVDAAGKNITGEGITVAVIDTGIDWTHPAFGGFSEVPNDKVVYAASLTGENPIDNFGHGSHVSGIIGADEYKETPRGDSQIKGMAPKAKLMGYKVLTAAGSGSATNIILAMEDAVKRGALVMNLSLGDTQGDPYSPESSAANNAMLAGVVVCIAAGNSGPESRSIGAPGAAHHVITVGASTDDSVTTLIAQLLVEGQAAKEIEMRLMDGSQALPNPALELPYVRCGLGTKASDFPKAVKGQIALIQRGSVTFSEKAINAQKAGAAAAVIYNNQEGNFFGTLGDDQDKPTISVVSVSKADGEAMLQSISAEDPEAVSKARIRLSPEQLPQPDHLAEFSSRGPNNDGWIKPELTAPGVNVRSATITQSPSPGGGMPDPSGYTSASGTSMATPHVAGAAALLRQAHPDWSSMQLKAALVNTARFMAGQGSVMDQGNGAIDLAKAIDVRGVLVTATDPITPTFSFGEVAHEGKEKVVTQALTIQSLVQGADNSTYTLSTEIAGAPEGLKAELSVETVSCDPVCVASFDLKLTADGTKLADGAYYGWVVAQAEWGALRLPFYCETAKEASQQPTQPTGGNQPRIPPERRMDGLVRR